MKKRKFRKIIFIILILVIIISAAIIYLNKVVLPVKLKSFIVSALEGQTQKKVSLESVQLNLLKGLVLRNLNVYDGQTRIIGLKEASCAFLILPVFKERKIIIPSIRLIAPTVFLERKADNTLNLLELLLNKKPEEEKLNFSVVVSGIIVTNGRVDFRDDTISPYFTKSVTGLDMDITFSMPANIKFEAKGTIQASPSTSVKINGNFSLPHKELTLKIYIRDLSPKEFSSYNRVPGLDIKDGQIDASIGARFKDGLLDADAKIQSKNIILSKDAVSLSLNADVSAGLNYDIGNALCSYSGEADIFKTDITGIDAIKEIKGVSGKIRFNNEGASSEKILATIFGLPIEAKINLADFKNPLLSLEAVSDLDLNNLQKVALEQFKISLPAEISGRGALSLNIKTKLPLQGPPFVHGSLNIRSGYAKIDKITSPLKNIDGLVEFDTDSLSWSRAHFTYADTVYATGGKLVNFRNPEVDLTASSQELSLASSFSVKDKYHIKINKLESAYLNSRLSLKGNLDITDMQSIRADLLADCDINLDDIAKKLPDKFKERFEKIKPRGEISAKAALKGSINHPKLCAITLEASSESLSLYGLKSNRFLLQYSQSDSIADIPILHLSLYDGAVDASAKANLDAEGLPFRLEIKIDGVKIESLKQDTPISKQDIAGTLQATGRLNGLLSDFSKISGSGEILIEDGKLWELNLFKGLGKLIFTKDFTNIIFSKGYCEFFVKDKLIFSDNIQFESNLANLKGKGKIGFDSSVEADINVEISSEFVPQTGTMKDITSALMGEAPRFAVIKIRGTLQKPEYVFDMAVLDVIKGVTGTIFEGIFGR